MKIPILQLNDVLITSIQVDLTDADALEFQSDLLHMVNQTGARGVVIDITAMEVVDSFMARVLNDTAEMVRVLGAEAVVSGMQPIVALTLMEMGRQLVGVDTTLDLDQAVVNARQLTARRQARFGSGAYSDDEAIPESQGFAPQGNGSSFDSFGMEASDG